MDKDFLLHDVLGSDFKNVKPDMSYDQVKRVVKDGGLHEFTYLHSDGSVYQMIGYTIDPGVFLSCIFKNYRLVKIIHAPPVATEDYRYDNGATATRAKLFRIDDDSQILRCLSAPILLKARSTPR